MKQSTNSSRRQVERVTRTSSSRLGATFVWQDLILCLFLAAGLGSSVLVPFPGLLKAEPPLGSCLPLAPVTILLSCHGAGSLCPCLPPSSGSHTSQRDIHPGVMDKKPGCRRGHMPTEASRMLRCRGSPQALGSNSFLLWLRLSLQQIPRQNLAVFKGLFLPTQFSTHWWD